MLARLMCLAFLLCIGNCRAGIPGTLTWSQMNKVVGHKVTVALPDGTVVSEKAQRVTPDALVVNVKQSGNEAAHPPGRVVEVPRASLRQLDVSRDSKHWRIIGTTVGVVVGFGVTAAYAIGNLFSPNDKSSAVAAVAIPGFGGTGYLLGHLADHRMKTVEIAP